MNDVGYELQSRTFEHQILKNHHKNGVKSYKRKLSFFLPCYFYDEKNQVRE
ncbi:hypothetical protein HMPREF0658_0614 [Hoylesella marshii DSM 16973 = JCM 13450]|uniref:Uncharacterized protein n=1 Tax=Hoylesella marshii DSM 16973 = JCM 13450 TaxID=862515 RepID=E0NR13_9BACT|nr:hypothetical protein HMPREF0658_0614 [Hoylesella marshii DSM 16973 = JCM 13450]